MRFYGAAPGPCWDRRLRITSAQEIHMGEKRCFAKSKNPDCHSALGTLVSGSEQEWYHFKRMQASVGSYIERLGSSYTVRDWISEMFTFTVSDISSRKPVNPVLIWSSYISYIRFTVMGKIKAFLTFYTRGNWGSMWLTAIVRHSEDLYLSPAVSNRVGQKLRHLESIRKTGRCG